MKTFITFFAFLFFLTACQKNQRELTSPLGSLQDSDSQLYSKLGREHQVEFEAQFRSEYLEISDIKQDQVIRDIQDTVRFLFGPLTRQELAGIQKGDKITLLLDQAEMIDGRVMIPYHYQGVWLIDTKGVLNQVLDLPVPYAVDYLGSPDWKRCTENDEEHGTWSFFWYFWDPTRFGCDHKEGVHFQMAQVRLGSETEQTVNSFPEYQRLIRVIDGEPELAMTFAFGYVSDPANPKPFTDVDTGIAEFQTFYKQLKRDLLPIGFQEKPILQSDIQGYGRTVIGAQFSGTKDNVQVRISVIAAAGIDQMDLFAHSYARKHEGFFGWFGHSRVGSGFDASRFEDMVRYEPSKYSISPEYQIVYWAGCNSYSYYTSPFFDLKIQLDPAGDPKGTRALDLISNALPSLFILNARNAQIVLKALINWTHPTSYQAIVNDIEMAAGARWSKVIVNVLGDEDNKK